MLKFYLIKKTCRGKSLKIIELVFSDFKVICQYVHAVGDEFYAGSNLVILIVPYLRLVAYGEIFDVFQQLSAVFAAVSLLKEFYKLLNLSVNICLVLVRVCVVRAI